MVNSSNEDKVIIAVKEYFENGTNFRIEKQNCFNNSVFKVNFSNNKEKTKVVLKLFKQKINEKRIKKEKNLFEYLINEIKLDIEFPEILYYDLSKEKIDYPFTIMKQIEGETLSNSYENIEHKEKLFTKLGEIIGKIHSLEFESYGYLDEDLNLKNTYGNWIELKIKLLEENIEKIKSSNLIDFKLISDLKRSTNLIREILEKETGPCLCHGDLSFSNVIVRNSQIVSLVDYEFIHSGAPLYDLFKTIRNFKKLFPYRKNLIKGYKKNKEIPEIWEKIMWAYQIIESTNWLVELNNMKWSELSEEESKERKELILKSAKIKIIDGLANIKL